MPPSSHGAWEEDRDRPDPIALLEEQNKTREPDLVPVRHGRMMVSPFTFYRGAAKIMAADLSETPTAGLDVQLCGDAHLSNFGVYASPERTLVFDLNDFDETLPGPFEYDVMRLAASFTIAARNNAYSKADVARRHARVGERVPNRDDRVCGNAARWRSGTTACRTRTSCARSTPPRVPWNGRARRRSRRTAERAAPEDRREGAVARQPAGAVEARRARRRRVPNRQPAADRGAVAARSPNASAYPPTRSSNSSTSSSGRTARRCSTIAGTSSSASEFVDAARKVVGVGSVGTGAYIVLLQGRDQQDPLFLQVKEATNPCSKITCRRAGTRQPGERVVHGQRLMQASSDIFLGWTKGVRGRTATSTGASSAT